MSRTGSETILLVWSNGKVKGNKILKESDKKKKTQ